MLTLDQLGEILRRAAPFGIRVAAPAADAEARRIDKHAVEATVFSFWGVMLHPGIALAGQRAALDIADAGAAQPLPGALQAPFRRVAGDELAAVSHRRGERQGLAAGAGAEIDDAHPGTRAGEKRGDLRAFVLHLDETVLEGGGAGKRHAMRDAQPERRPAGRVGVDMLGGESAAGGVAVGLQRVDAQIEGRGSVERRHLGFETVAVKLGEVGFEPVRDVVRNGTRHLRMCQAAAGETQHEPLFVAAQRRRPEAPAVKALCDLLGRPGIDQQ